MQRALASIVLLAWAIWFGGTILLFTAVSSLFATFADDHATAGLAASGVFHSFNKLQLLVGAIVLVTTFVWRLSADRAVPRVLPIILVLAWAILLFIVAWLTPRIDAIRISGDVKSDAFRHLHGFSMVCYLTQAMLLAGAGVALTRVTRRG